MAGSSRLDWGCLAMGQAGWAVGEGPCGAILDKSVPATFIRTGCFERILKLAGFLDQVFESLALSIVDHVAAYLRLGCNNIACNGKVLLDPRRRQSWGRARRGRGGHVFLPRLRIEVENLLPYELGVAMMPSVLRKAALDHLFQMGGVKEREAYVLPVLA